MWLANSQLSEGVWDWISTHSISSYPQSASDILENRNPVVSIFWDNSTVRHVSFLDSHFGIVPWVIIGTWMMENRDCLPIHVFKRKFIKPMKPWMEIIKWMDRGDIKVISRNTNGMYEVIAEMASTMWKEVEFWDYSMSDDIENITLEPGKDWVPHGDKFRFCDTVGTHSDMLIGEYNLWSEYIDRKGLVPFWQAEEACAQIMLWAYRTTKWEDAAYGTYAEANTKWSINFPEMIKNLKPWQKLCCTWVAEEIKDEKDRVKQIRFRYSCTIDGALFFQWNIVGNAISKKMWDRTFSSLR